MAQESQAGRHRLTQLWWGATALGCYYVYHRYYFYGKIQANYLESKTEADWKELAELNKR